MTSASPTASVCVSGAGSGVINGTYTYIGTATANGFIRPRYEGNLTGGFVYVLITAIGGAGAVWSIYSSNDEESYYLGNTTPPPQYPYQETSWSLIGPGVLPLPTVNVFACP
jgi:hypothetical protein